ncbi:J domain-containing protein [Natronobiforma cellulositropha]|uniref:J domain-containing protein n=1 Tax=Natronobiforma cellulositropha TaxID=1679076 RepID=UPI0021D5C592|nr:J domain-containing protein [Natronobiforma cellulositropha]
MYRSPLVLGLAAVFAGLTALLLIGAVVSAQPVAAAVAVPFGVTSYFMYYHGSGKLARAAYRSHASRTRRGERARGGFGAGPRASRGPRTRAERAARAGGVGAGPRGGPRRGGTGRAPTSQPGPTRTQARRTLGVSEAADAGEVKRAYREKVKEVHPDRGGDEEAFKRVTAAYDRLSE